MKEKKEREESFAQGRKGKSVGLEKRITQRHKGTKAQRRKEREDNAEDKRI